MKKRYRSQTLLSAALLLLIFMSGCATVTRGTKDTLVIESEPPGAEVSLSNGMHGKTPTSFKLPRKDTVVVKITKDGYEPVEVNVHSQISGAGGAGMAGNVLVGGLIGAAIDAGSGAMNDLRPNPVRVTLVPLGKPEDAEDIVMASAEGESEEERLEKLQEMLEEGVITEEEYNRQRKAILSEI
jgi:hypothetical protein